MSLKASEPTALFFMEQCIGVHNGHMAEIPNNPVLEGLCRTHMVKDKITFALFLKSVAEQLEKQPEF